MREVEDRDRAGEVRRELFAGSAGDFRVTAAATVDGPNAGCDVTGGACVACSCAFITSCCFIPCSSVDDLFTREDGPAVTVRLTSSVVANRSPALLRCVVAVDSFPVLTRTLLRPELLCDVEVPRRIT